jgi:hypothetical protein
MSTEQNGWTDEAKVYLEGYLQQVQSLLAGQAVDAGEIVSDLRDHVRQLAVTHAGSLVTLPDVKRMLATVGTPEEVAESWAQLRVEAAEDGDPWSPAYLNIPPPKDERPRGWKWVIAGAVAIFLIPFVVHFAAQMRTTGEDASETTDQAITTSARVANDTLAVPDLVGSWQSVDFVSNVEEFRPGMRAWKGGDLFLKGLECFPDGKTSIGYTFDDTSVTDADSNTRAEYTLKTIGGKRYLFLPWLSGDVTIRGMAPKYYVLTPGTVAGTEAAPPPAPKPRSTGATVAANTQNPANLTGVWRTVDFVTTVNDFNPGKRAWSTGDFFLKDLECRADGTTSLGYTWWANGWMAGQDGQTSAEYFVKELSGATYLFLPWLSGDVTIRGMAPKYYVLKKDQSAPASHDLPGNGPVVGGDITGSWQSVDFVSRAGDFNPAIRAFGGNLFLKELHCDARGGTSIGEGWSIDGRIIDNESAVQATYYTQELNGTTYLYYPWLSGDVTIRGMAPKYYVLKKTR